MRTSYPLYKVIGVLCAAGIAGSVLAGDIQLAGPQKTGGMPLMEALAKRSTSRAFASREVPMEKLSSLLWASFGVSRPDGKRTAPSALNKQATDIYVLLKEGAYVYDAKGNKLEQVAREDLRTLGGTQEFATNAPVILVFVVDHAKMGDGSDESKRDMSNLNAGYISQNTYLYCTSAGLATGARASVDRKALGPKLKLRPDQRIIIAHSVGYAKP